MKKMNLFIPRYIRGVFCIADTFRFRLQIDLLSNVFILLQCRTQISEKSNWLKNPVLTEPRRFFYCSCWNNSVKVCVFLVPVVKLWMSGCAPCVTLHNCLFYFVVALLKCLLLLYFLPQCVHRLCHYLPRPSVLHLSGVTFSPLVCI